MPATMRVATDTAAFRCSADGALEVLLVERGNEPFKGHWALPGGFVDLDEDLPDAAARELMEETGLRAAAMTQVGAWGKPGRDSRGRTVGIVYVGVARPGQDAVQGGDDAARAAWHPVDVPPRPMAFDHAEVLAASVARLHLLCENTHAILAFAPDLFGPNDVARVIRAMGVAHADDVASRLLAAARVEQAAGRPGAFRMKGSDFLAPLREPVYMFGAARPAGG